MLAVGLEAGGVLAVRLGEVGVQDPDLRFEKKKTYIYIYITQKPKKQKFNILKKTKACRYHHNWQEIYSI